MIKSLGNFSLKFISLTLVISLIFPVSLAVAATAPSTITLNSNVAANSIVTYKTAVTFTGTITPAHQSTVYIQAKRKGKTNFSTIGTTTSDASGNYTYTFNVGASGTYRAKWNGDADHASATSSEIVILSQAAVTLTTSAKPSWAGQEFYVTGTLRPSHRGVNISVQENTTRWKTIAKGKTDVHSNFSIKTSIAGIGNHRLRVAFSDADHELSTSDSALTVSLRWANPWKISAAYKEYIVISKKTYKLWFLRKGRIVKTFRAGVGQKAYPTPSGNWKIVNKAVRPTWYNPNTSWSKNMPKSIPWPKSPFGERALYLNASGIRIHGTTQPWLLDRPNRAISHGCIRLKNEWIIWLYKRVPKSTNVKIY